MRALGETNIIAIKYITSNAVTEPLRDIQIVQVAQIMRHEDLFCLAVCTSPYLYMVNENSTYHIHTKALRKG